MAFPEKPFPDVIRQRLARIETKLQPLLAEKERLEQALAAYAVEDSEPAPHPARKRRGRKPTR